MSTPVSTPLPLRCTAILVTLLSGSLLAQAQTATVPQLGKASIKEVLAALTPEEKVKLVVGMGFYPSGFPAGMLPPGDPGDDKVPEKVPGAAGRTHAIPRLGIPSLTLADGPAGVRIDPIRNGDSTKTYYATAFPVATLLASSWDTALVRTVGQAFGREVRAYGIDVLLAPGMNIHRNPLGGRNFEYYSEDPVVTGNLVAAFVNGVESNGVGTSIKHFAVNNQEFNRMKLNSQVSERALREIYLKGFELAVKKAQPWTVMSSYNKVNGTYTSESPDLLTTLLRQEWGFAGLVMTDWYGGLNAAAQLKAGNDLLMPGTAAQTQALLAALRNGQLTTAQLDANVTRVLELVLKSPTFRNLTASSSPPLQANAAVARRGAAESMVLLRNQAQTLPLKAGRTVALFGNTSYNLIAGGTGSGDVNRAYTVSPAQGLAAAGFTVHAPLSQAYSQYLRAEKAKLPKTKGLLDPAPVIAEMPLEAAQVPLYAQAADVAVVTLGRSAGEGGDRQVANDFTLTAAEQTLLKQVATAFHAQGKKVVVVLNVGGVMEVASWRDQADAILLAWQPGQEGGHALADVLSGQVNPSGKLATTFPVAYTDVPYSADFPGRVKSGAAPPASSFQGQDAENTYQEGVYVGYRYFTTFQVRPAYEFGHGLSYTSFTYSPLQLSKPTASGQLTATLTVTNTGRVAGREVVQLYVGAPAERLTKPVRELKAFAKTGVLAPGKSQTLTFRLTAADLASYHTGPAAWVAEAGTYTVQAGASSLDIKQRASFQLPKEIVSEKSRPLLVPQSAIAELPAPRAK
ncbi:glycoside hydrolase family 3 C-terminal domain-containing protein [Hymenobacter weizhouensis]|uniref:glycoside hydrolase family 3 C-terminal domain-containing protein n=1 Tax=Hymenobacter sp. YIM 151500-1 TaxID=2987689 RepID=UPI002227F83F|nr:glycoside hydrolase family 3 C-terminal domain-containing protein [Hymenobacter sp. YIM 151500-1]UYZ64473.1 glycoside hydrolase family 3 C-terminal domain-containing protein [Hymenobacter sp. YIM 151500-1]